MVNLVCSRFSVRIDGVHKGVIIPRTDGWVFVPINQPSNGAFLCYPGESPVACIFAAGYKSCSFVEVQ